MKAFSWDAVSCEVVPSDLPEGLFLDSNSLVWVDRFIAAQVAGKTQDEAIAYALSDSIEHEALQLQGMVVEQLADGVIKASGLFGDRYQPAAIYLPLRPEFEKAAESLAQLDLNLYCEEIEL